MAYCSLSSDVDTLFGSLVKQVDLFRIRAQAEFAGEAALFAGIFEYDHLAADAHIDQVCIAQRFHAVHFATDGVFFAFAQDQVGRTDAEDDRLAFVGIFGVPRKIAANRSQG